MGYATVRSHTRRGYQVRAHARRTSGRHIADILQREPERRRALRRAGVSAGGERVRHTP